jgi:uncharacterized protein YacL
MPTWATFKGDVDTVELNPEEEVDELPEDSSVTRRSKPARGKRKLQILDHIMRAGKQIPIYTADETALAGHRSH